MKMQQAAKNAVSMSLIVQFSHRKRRNAVLEKSSKTRLSAKDLEFENHSPIYVNEHVCFDLKWLFDQANSNEREGEWKFVCVKYGPIAARKAEAAAAVEVTTSDEVSKITRD